MTRITIYDLVTKIQSWQIINSLKKNPPNPLGFVSVLHACVQYVFLSILSALPTLFFEVQALLNCIKILDVENALISAGNWQVTIFVVARFFFFFFKGRKNPKHHQKIPNQPTTLCPGPLKPPENSFQFWLDSS